MVKIGTVATRSVAWVARRPVKARDEEDLVRDDAEEGEEGDLEPVALSLPRCRPGEESRGAGRGGGRRGLRGRPRA